MHLPTLSLEGKVILITGGVGALGLGIVGVGMAKRQWDTDPVYRARAKRAIPLGHMQKLESVIGRAHV